MRNVKVYGIVFWMMIICPLCTYGSEPLTSEKWEEIVVHIDDYLTEDGKLDLSDYTCGNSDKDILNPSGVFSLELGLIYKELSPREYRSQMRKVKILILPNAATSIAAFMFYLMLPNLESIKGVHIIDIGKSVFYSCSKLSSVEFPNAETIGEGSFFNCDNLIVVQFSKVTTIGKGAFIHCNNLSSVQFPQVTSIGASAFYDCLNLENPPSMWDCFYE